MVKFGTIGNSVYTRCLLFCFLLFSLANSSAEMIKKILVIETWNDSPLEWRSIQKVIQKIKNSLAKTNAPEGVIQAPIYPGGIV